MPVVFICHTWYLVTYPLLCRVEMNEGFSGKVFNCIGGQKVICFLQSIFMLAFTLDSNS